ncbi:hypothetical protein G210_4173 [Candida maltosa Xu316]|uniref:Telomerase reverse transcriptase n=1 Tax=Candida maltosa (strain Xu316) TaxID=1245528 RepID=M3JTF8_CANMX|nr:hypothetical protein G210_4173 [Candida maltosa Xu316]
MEEITLHEYIWNNTSEVTTELPSFTEYLNHVTVSKFTTHELPTIRNHGSYEDFVTSILNHLVMTRSRNILVSGYRSESHSELPIINSNANFLATYLSHSNWNRIFELVGVQRFLELIINYRGFHENSNGGKVQLFGDVATFGGSAQPTSKFINKYDILFQSRKIKYTNFQVIRQTPKETVKQILSNCSVNVTELSKRFKNIKHMVSKIIQNDKKCRYDILCQKFLGTTGCNYADILENETREDQVVSLVLIIMGHLLPLDAWGGPINKKIIQERIVDFIKLGSGGRLHIDDIVRGIKLQDFTWFGNIIGRATSKQEFHIRQSLLIGYVRWLIDSLVKTILRSFWYITDSSNMESTKLLHFPHFTWNSLFSNWMVSYSKQNLEKVDETNFTGKYDYGKLKLVPKKSSFRVICVPIKRSYASIGQKLSPSEVERELYEFRKYSTNVLHPVRQVLRLKVNEQKKAKPSYATSVYSSTEVVEKIVKFRDRLVTKFGEETPLVYMIKFDMKECYDRINQDALMNNIRDLFSKEDDDSTFYVRDFSQLDEMYKVKRPITSTDTHFHKFDTLSMFQNAKGTRSDKTKTLTVKKREIIQICHEQIYDVKCLIKNQSGNFEWYRRKRGVFQGFCLSSIFCDILYNSMVDDKFGYLWDSSSEFLFVRLADDFLFMSTDAKLYRKVSSTVSGKTLQKYGAFVNNEKTVAINSSMDECVMKFIGLEINAKTLAVKKNMSGILPSVQNIRSFKSLLKYLTTFYFNNLDNTMLEYSTSELGNVLEPFPKMIVFNAINL